jgi:hypothetical protein
MRHRGHIDIRAIAVIGCLLLSGGMEPVRNLEYALGNDAFV